MILRQEFLNTNVCMNSVFILDGTIVESSNSKIFHLPPHLLLIRTTMISAPIKKKKQTGFYSTVILSILYLLMSVL